MSANLTRLSGSVWDTLDLPCKIKICPNKNVMNGDILDTGIGVTP